MYYTYILRCEDNSIYTGIATDINRRMEEHFTQNKKGAKYTKSHMPKKVVAVWKSKDKSNASRLEAYIKTLTKKQKEEIIINNNLKEYLKEKIDLRRYRRIELQKIINSKYL